MDQPLFISVIIPTYNRAKLIKNTLESVFSQTYTNYEVIIVDNCSTDNTQELLQPLVDEGKIRFIKHDQNYERARSRNTGMENARGNYLLFLDSDDLLVPTALETLSAIAEKFPVSEIIAGTFQVIDENEKATGLNNLTRVNREIRDSNVYLQIIRNLYFPMGSYIIKKEAALSIKGFDTSLEAGEDFDFCLRACFKCIVSCTNINVINIRRHVGNTLIDEKWQRSSIKIFQNQLDNLNKTGKNFSPQFIKQAKSELYFAIADILYGLGDNSIAFKYYRKVVTFDPKKVFDRFLVKQLFAASLPKSISDKLKRHFDKTR